MCDAQLGDGAGDLLLATGQLGRRGLMFSAAERRSIERPYSGVERDSQMNPAHGILLRVQTWHNDHHRAIENIAKIKLLNRWGAGSACEAMEA
jgi:hypothetical protein